MHIIVGTAGHIDHGKTTLIKALTGTDTDRLPEEKKRGITIDLGFAELDLGEHRIGFVDVPGHERFVKNMLAGASGIDLVLLIIAADEGVMPQTREHFDICRLLGVQNGLIVLTKKDMVDDELLDLVRMEAAELAEGSFLENAPLIAVSSTNGDGLDELREAMAIAANSVGARREDQVTRFPIDRSFVIKGFGTVVTGTLASGEIREGSELELLPEGRKVRIRGLQTHGRETRSASAGQRVAVNLAGIDHNEVSRGMTLAEPGTLEAVQIFDARVEVLKSAPRPLRSRQRVRVHIGTAEALARIFLVDPQGEIAAGGSGPVQFRLEGPVAAVMGEKFIIRSYSPQTTIAGGTVIDPLAPKHKGRTREAARTLLTALTEADGDHQRTIEILVRDAGADGVSPDLLQHRTGLRSDVIASALTAITGSGMILETGGRWFAKETVYDLKNVVLSAVGRHHERDAHSRGIPREELREKLFARSPVEIFKFVLTALENEGKIAIEKDVVRSKGHSLELSAPETKFLEIVGDKVKAAGLGPAKIDEVITEAAAAAGLPAANLTKLVGVGAAGIGLVKVSDEFYFSNEVIESLARSLRARAESLPNRLIDVPAFKELAGVSRKYAIPLLEYFDRVGVTKRAGDKRIVM
ncbi:MAG: selenocysteine-specific translation elongation factor [Pyrinomonadaceae bacterium]